MLSVTAYIIRFLLLFPSFLSLHVGGPRNEASLSVLGLFSVDLILEKCLGTANDRVS